LFAAVSFTLHVVVNQKHLGHLAIMLFYIAVSFSSRFGIDHGLLVFGSDPGWVYSDMNGFGPFVEGFVWFKLYWGAWAFLLLVIAALFWMRGTESGLHQRLAMARTSSTTTEPRRKGSLKLWIMSDVLDASETRHSRTSSQRTYASTFIRTIDSSISEEAISW
jgi:ABC-2 type transport system permease protein